MTVGSYRGSTSSSSGRPLRLAKPAFDHRRSWRGPQDARLSNLRVSLYFSMCWVPRVVLRSLHFGAIIQGQSFDHGIVLLVGRAVRHIASFGDGIIHLCDGCVRHFFS